MPTDETPERTPSSPPTNHQFKTPVVRETRPTDPARSMPTDEADPDGGPDPEGQAAAGTRAK